MLLRLRDQTGFEERQAGGARRSARASSVARTTKRAAERRVPPACAGFVSQLDKHGLFDIALKQAGSSVATEIPDLAVRERRELRAVLDLRGIRLCRAEHPQRDDLRCETCAIR